MILRPPFIPNNTLGVYDGLKSPSVHKEARDIAVDHR